MSERINSFFRPNYRRARALALEIEAARHHLSEVRSDPRSSPAEIQDLLAEIQFLEHEFGLTGVTSEYDL